MYLLNAIFYFNEIGIYVTAAFIIAFEVSTFFYLLQQLFTIFIKKITASFLPVALPPKGVICYKRLFQLFGCSILN